MTDKFDPHWIHGHITRDGRKAAYNCIGCRHWSPVYEGYEGAGVDEFDPDDPGVCMGQVGKFSSLNGMWTKSSDCCDRWEMSPIRSSRIEVEEGQGLEGDSK